VNNKSWHMPTFIIVIHNINNKNNVFYDIILLIE